LERPHCGPHGAWPTMAPRRLGAPQKDGVESWNAEQAEIAKKRVSHDQFDWLVDGDGIHRLHRIGGVDLSFFPDERYAVAAVVVLSFPQLEVIYERCVTVQLTVPYVPGYLAFREMPSLAKLLQAIDGSAAPQVVLVDGNGIFHPRYCGAATHLGVVVDLPTIGVAKTVLQVGRLGPRVAGKISKTLQGPGQWAEFAEEGQEPLAVLLRPGSGSRPLVVSPGHRVCVATAAAVVAAVCRSSVPEPIRQADRRSRQAVTAWLAGTPLSDLDVEQFEVPEPSQKRRRRSGKAQPEAPERKQMASLVWRPKALQEVLAQKAAEEADDLEVEVAHCGTYILQYIYSWLCCVGR